MPGNPAENCTGSDMIGEYSAPQRPINRDTMRSSIISIKTGERTEYTDSNTQNEPMKRKKKHTKKHKTEIKEKSQTKAKVIIAEVMSSSCFVHQEPAKKLTKSNKSKDSKKSYGQDFNGEASHPKLPVVEGSLKKKKKRQKGDKKRLLEDGLKKELLTPETQSAAREQQMVTHLQRWDEDNKQHGVTELFSQRNDPDSPETTCQVHESVGQSQEPVKKKRKQKTKLHQVADNISVGDVFSSVGHHRGKPTYSALDELEDCERWKKSKIVYMEHPLEDRSVEERSSHLYVEHQESNMEDCENKNNWKQGITEEVVTQQKNRRDLVILEQVVKSVDSGEVCVADVTAGERKKQEAKAVSAEVMSSSCLIYQEPAKKLTKSNKSKDSKKRHGKDFTGGASHPKLPVVEGSSKKKKKQQKGDKKRLLEDGLKKELLTPETQNAAREEQMVTHLQRWDEDNKQHGVTELFSQRNDPDSPETTCQVHESVGQSQEPVKKKRKQKTKLHQVADNISVGDVFSSVGHHRGKPSYSALTELEDCERWKKSKIVYMEHPLEDRSVEERSSHLYVEHQESNMEDCENKNNWKQGITEEVVTQQKNRRDLVILEQVVKSVDSGEVCVADVTAGERKKQAAKAVTAEVMSSSCLIYQEPAKKLTKSNKSKDSKKRHGKDFTGEASHPKLPVVEGSSKKKKKQQKGGKKRLLEDGLKKELLTPETQSAAREQQMVTHLQSWDEDNKQHGVTELFSQRNYPDPTETTCQVHESVGQSQEPVKKKRKQKTKLHQVADNISVGDVFSSVSHHRGEPSYSALAELEDCERWKKSKIVYMEHPLEDNSVEERSSHLYVEHQESNMEDCENKNNWKQGITEEVVTQQRNQGDLIIREQVVKSVDSGEVCVANVTAGERKKQEAKAVSAEVMSSSCLIYQEPAKKLTRSNKSKDSKKRHGKDFTGKASHPKLPVVEGSSKKKKKQQKGDKKRLLEDGLKKELLTPETQNAAREQQMVTHLQRWDEDNKQHGVTELFSQRNYPDPIETTCQVHESVGQSQEPVKKKRKQKTKLHQVADNISVGDVFSSVGHHRGEPSYSALAELEDCQRWKKSKTVYMEHPLEDRSVEERSSHLYVEHQESNLEDCENTNNWKQGITEEVVTQQKNQGDLVIREQVVKSVDLGEVCVANVTAGERKKQEVKAVSAEIMSSSCLIYQEPAKKLKKSNKSKDSKKRHGKDFTGKASHPKLPVVEGSLKKKRKQQKDDKKLLLEDGLKKDSLTPETQSATREQQMVTHLQRWDEDNKQHGVTELFSQRNYPDPIETTCQVHESVGQSQEPVKKKRKQKTKLHQVADNISVGDVFSSVGHHRGEPSYSALAELEDCQRWKKSKTVYMEHPLEDRSVEERSSHLYVEHQESNLEDCENTNNWKQGITEEVVTQQKNQGDLVIREQVVKSVDLGEVCVANVTAGERKKQEVKAVSAEIMSSSCLIYQEPAKKLKKSNKSKDSKKRHGKDFTGKASHPKLPVVEGSLKKKRKQQKDDKKLLLEDGLKKDSLTPETQSATREQQMVTHLQRWDEDNKQHGVTELFSQRNYPDPTETTCQVHESVGQSQEPVKKKRKRTTKLHQVADNISVGDVFSSVGDHRCKPSYSALDELEDCERWKKSKTVYVEHPLEDRSVEERSSHLYVEHQESHLEDCENKNNWKQGITEEVVTQQKNQGDLVIREQVVKSVDLGEVCVANVTAGERKKQEVKAVSAEIMSSSCLIYQEPAKKLKKSNKSKDSKKRHGKDFTGKASHPKLPVVEGSLKKKRKQQKDDKKLLLEDGLKKDSLTPETQSATREQQMVTHLQRWDEDNKQHGVTELFSQRNYPDPTETTCQVHESVGQSQEPVKKKRKRTTKLHQVADNISVGDVFSSVGDHRCKPSYSALDELEDCERWKKSKTVYVEHPLEDRSVEERSSHLYVEHQESNLEDCENKNNWKQGITEEVVTQQRNQGDLVILEQVDKSVDSGEVCVANVTGEERKHPAQEDMSEIVTGTVEMEDINVPMEIRNSVSILVVEIEDDTEEDTEQASISRWDRAQTSADADQNLTIQGQCEVTTSKSDNRPQTLKKNSTSLRDKDIALLEECFPQVLSLRPSEYQFVTQLMEGLLIDQHVMNIGGWSIEELNCLTVAVKEFVLDSLRKENNGEEPLTVPKERLYKGIPWFQIQEKVAKRNWIQCGKIWFRLMLLRMNNFIQLFRGMHRIQSYIKIIRWLHDYNSTNYSTVNWDELSNHIGNVPPFYTRVNFHRLKKCVPNWKNLQFYEIVDYMYNESMPLLEAQLLAAQEYPVKPEKKDEFLISEIFKEFSECEGNQKLLEVT